MLPPAVKREAERSAASLATESTKVWELRSTQILECCKRMILAVTPPGTEDIMAEGVQWQALTLQDLSMVGPNSYDEIFTTLDQEALEAIYRRYHDLSKDDLDAILGKALLVASEG